MNMQTFRSDLAKAIASKGYSQSKVAEITGVSQSSLSFFLSGERDGLSGESVLRLWFFVYGHEPTPPAEARP